MSAGGELPLLSNKTSRASAHLYEVEFRHPKHRAAAAFQESHHYDKNLPQKRKGEGEP